MLEISSQIARIWLPISDFKNINHILIWYDRLSFAKNVQLLENFGSKNSDATETRQTYPTIQTISVVYTWYCWYCCWSALRIHWLSCLSKNFKVWLFNVQIIINNLVSFLCLFCGNIFSRQLIYQDRRLLLIYLRQLKFFFETVSGIQ